MCGKNANVNMRGEKMATITKKRAFWHYEVLRELEHVLDGKCSDELESCPSYIASRLFGSGETKGKNTKGIYDETRNRIWCCVDCVELFSPFANLHMLAKRRFNKTESQIRGWGKKFHTSTRYPCPCVLSCGFPDDLPGPLVIERVLERISELAKMYWSETL